MLRGGTGYSQPFLVPGSTPRELHLNKSDRSGGSHLCRVDSRVVSRGRVMRSGERRLSKFFRLVTCSERAGNSDGTSNIGDNSCRCLARTLCSLLLFPLVYSVHRVLPSVTPLLAFLSCRTPDRCCSRVFVFTSSLGERRIDHSCHTQQL